MRHLLAAVGASAALLLASAGAALGASPTPSPGIGDPRSSGEGPGLVGDPLTAILVVVAIAAVTVGITLAYVRVTGGRGDAPGP
ncbi:MAG TPA: hypothetical protein VIZ22_08275 [Candidatus Limnocylindrales bacterium]